MIAPLILEMFVNSNIVNLIEVSKKKEFLEGHPDEVKSQVPVPEDKMYSNVYDNFIKKYRGRP